MRPRTRTHFLFLFILSWALRRLDFYFLLLWWAPKEWKKEKEKRKRKTSRKTKQFLMLNSSWNRMPVFLVVTSSSFSSGILQRIPVLFSSFSIFWGSKLKRKNYILNEPRRWEERRKQKPNYFSGTSYFLAFSRV